ncbi:hypothetical protein GWI33_002816 [Rhynchophorus ferrugineus]|uniref:Saccharopine dehydrogenase NADP binding domain-containing protein n=1 Tax=Rhynchophorus ferrugineus TaxID=354439 RepID=A0A834IVQ1_RHYFE|nr:hypothetical protein GWI33_002816 [Rhynchophorus ferrugineus]
MENRLDIIIFGASGFTGLHCIPYIAKLSKSDGRNLSWGVAGRSEDKLKNILSDIGQKLEVNFDSVKIIIADINDHDSLLNMAKQARLVINCCGPYRLYGEAMVKACIEAGTHHVDVSGEPEYMEKMQLEYHDAAVKKGVYAISACGFDSIPSDLGIVFLQQSFSGTLNSVETYLKCGTTDNVKGSLINYGTWQSLVHSIENRKNLKQLRQKLYEKIKKPPTFQPKQKFIKYPHKDDKVSGWVLPFLGADQAVIRRSQSYFYENNNQRPIQASTYFVLKSTLDLLLFIIFAIIFGIISYFKFGRKLLLDYPQIFTGGFISKKQPEEDTVQKTWFKVDFYAEGWKEKLENKDDQYTTPVDCKISGRVKGNNPGYGTTCVCLVLAGIIILTEKEKLANNGNGGIFSPGAAFAKTSLIKQLNENEVTFEVLSETDI